MKEKKRIETVEEQNAVKQEYKAEKGNIRVCAGVGGRVAWN